MFTVLPPEHPAQSQELPMELDEEEEKELDALLEGITPQESEDQEGHREQRGAPHEQATSGFTLVENRRQIKGRLREQASGMVRKRLKTRPR